MRWTYYQTFIIFLFIVAGVVGAVLTKLSNLQQAVGIDGEVRYFQHPFLQTSMGFLGVSLNLILFKIIFCCLKKKDETSVDENILTRGNRDFNVAILILPSCFDLIGTCCVLVGLVLTHLASLVMLRSSIVVFTAILSYFAFEQILNWREGLGVFFVTVGLVLVGLSDYLAQKEEDATGIWSVVLGDLLAVVGSFLGACQAVLEEKYLKSLDLPPLQVVGWEGLIAFGILGFLHVPLHYIPIGPPMGDNSRGTMENIPDGCVRMYNNWIIAVCMSIKVLSTATYYFCGVTVSKELSSTTRKVIDSLKIIPIWLVSALAFGQTFQYVQLIGLLTLLLGQALYHDMGCMRLHRKLSFHHHHDAIEEQSTQPTSSRGQHHSGILVQADF